MWILIFGLAMAFSSNVSVADSPASQCEVSTAKMTIAECNEARHVADLIREWVEVGWRHLESDPPFNFHDRLEKFYDWSSPDVVLFDNLDPEKRINYSAKDYAAIWDASLPSLKKLTNELVGEPAVYVSGNLAIVEVSFITRFQLVDGTDHEAPTFSSLVWRKSEKGWRIIREHGTGLSI